MFFQQCISILFSLFNRALESHGFVDGTGVDMLHDTLITHLG